ncbi:MAG: lysophospholipid acyltransferase family protein [Pseudomonadota bacterium]
MILLRSILFDFLLYLSMVVMGIVLAPAAIWSRDGAYWAMKLYCTWIFFLLRVLVGLRIDVRGTIPQEPVLVASKHQSFLDIMIHMHSLPRARFIMKDQLKWAPIIGVYGMRIGSTPVSRGKKGKAISAMLAAESGRGAEGQLVIYPQGTRTLPGQHLPYNIGAGALYTRMEQTCVPAATNVGVFWARRSWLRKPGLAVVEYLEPIAPGMGVEPFLAELETRIETASDALMAEAGYEKTPSA